MQTTISSSCFDVPVTAAADDADMPVEPGPLTRSRMAAAKRRAASRPSPTEIRVTTNARGKPDVSLPCTDTEGWMALAVQAFGTVSPAFVETETPAHDGCSMFLLRRANPGNQDERGDSRC